MEHPSELNKAFVKAFKEAAGADAMPSIMAVGGYDAMAVIYAALNATGGDTDGTALVDAMKGMEWESPRGPISIDPDTRDIVQNIYLRKVEKVDDRYGNVEFETFEPVK